MAPTSVDNAANGTALQLPRALAGEPVEDRSQVNCVGPSVGDSPPTP
ncbi:hypothetical protein [Microtetraspora fusca]|uniref:Uncharacterized protein n=1 Tax=Microtetraspora fusca TaxID=1997 RepID=A0ABW6VJV4_MICFU|nr:hypothetical protein [Microtetraspora fusca]